MSDRLGKHQNDFAQYCKKVLVILEKISTSENGLKKMYITEGADQLRSIGESLVEAVKAFGDMDNYTFIQSINRDSESATWTDDSGFENACRYLENLIKVVRNIIRISEDMDEKECLCCHDSVYFVPYSREFLAMRGIRNAIPEFDNLKENICPNCMSNDRDRAIVCFLKRMRLDEGNKPVEVLQLAPSKSIEHWIYAECPTVIYHSADIGLNGRMVFDLSGLAELRDESHDYIFCPNMMPYDKTEDALANELIRILKADGLCLFSFPSSLERNDMGQDFLKTGFIKKFTDAGFDLHKLGRDSHQKQAYAEHAVLYVMTRIKGNIDHIILRRAADRYDGSMEKPLVSVIMSVYNHEKYVSRAIESVLCQGYENIEFLVADDCSADGSADRILKYQERIDEIHLFEENGFGRIPFLLSIAKGKYIAVLDSDDYWEPDKIERQVLYMETHPECGACFTGVRGVDGNDEEVNLQFFESQNRSSAEWINYFCYNGNCLAYPSVMIKRELHINVMRQGSNFSIVPDYVMWLNVLLDYDIHLIEKELLNYRWHGLNDSKPTEGRFKNQYYEQNCCWLGVMKKMDSSLFLKAFREELTDPDVKDPKEILCEKALILLKSAYRLAGLFYTYELLSDQEIKKIMEEKYHLGRREICEILNSI